jgi:uncharacterized protein YbaR (Trm112 family)
MANSSTDSASPLIPEDFLSILRCVNDDHTRDDGVLRIDGDTLVCTVCGYAYIVKEGIPNMLWEEAIPPDGDETSTAL